MRHRERGARARDGGCALRDIARRAGVPLVFKASYDKANRTSTRSFRGPGLAEGLRILGRVRETVGVPDPHRHSRGVAGGAGGRSRRRPADSGVPVAADRPPRRRGPHRARRQHQEGTVPRAARHAARDREGHRERQPKRDRHRARVHASATTTSSSTCAPSRSCDRSGYPVVYDVTHSLQLPGRRRRRHRGQAEFIEPMASAGVAAGVDGVFMEVHENPPQAKSDAQNALQARSASRAPRRARSHSRHRARSRPARPSGARDDAADAGYARRASSWRRRFCASRRRRFSASSIALDGAFEQRGRSCCSTAAAASSSPAWASRASSAGRSRRRSRAPARPPGSSIPPRPSTATSARFAKTTWCMALSHSGETEELIRLLESIRRHRRTADRADRSAGVDARRARPTSRSTAASPKKPAR